MPGEWVSECLCMPMFAHVQLDTSHTKTISSFHAIIRPVGFNSEFTWNSIIFNFVSVSVNQQENDSSNKNDFYAIHTHTCIHPDTHTLPNKQMTPKHKRQRWNTAKQLQEYRNQRNKNSIHIRLLLLFTRVKYNSDTLSKNAPMSLHSWLARYIHIGVFLRQATAMRMKRNTK